MTTPQPPAQAKTTPPGGLALSCAVLLGVMGLVLAAVGTWAQSNHGSTGLVAAVTAWGLCTVAALAALILSASFAATPLAPTVNLGTMLVRMGVPLFGLVVLPNVAPSLAAAGLLPCLLVCYLAALVVETLLALRHVVPTLATNRVSSSASAQALEAK